MKKNLLPLVILVFSYSNSSAQCILDPTFSDSFFNMDGVAITTVGTSIDNGDNAVLQSDGKIVVIGETSYNGADYDLVVLRHNADGSLDNSFDTDGIYLFSFGDGSETIGEEILIQPDGKILAMGYCSSGANQGTFVFRLNADGTLDNSFSGDGVAAIGMIGGYYLGSGGAALQTDGKIVVAGAYNNDFGLLRLNTDGSIDNGFGTSGLAFTDLGSVEDVKSVAIHSSGKILVAGSTNSVSADFAVARYDTNGAIDNSFSGDGFETVSLSASVDMPSDMVVAADGSVYVVGTASSDMQLLKLSSSGNLDLSFAGDGILSLDIAAGNDVATAVALHPNGYIFMTGPAQHGLVHYSALACVGTSGNLVTTFGTGGLCILDQVAVETPTNGMFIQPDGKIVVVGHAVAGPLNEKVMLARYDDQFTGMTETSIGSSIKIFPNPAVSSITIDGIDNLEGYYLTICDLSGRIVYTEIITKNEAYFLNIDNLVSGTYSLAIKNETGTQTTRFVKQ